MVKLVKAICLARWETMNAVNAEFGDDFLEPLCQWRVKGYDGCKMCHSFKTVEAAVKEMRRYMEKRNQYREKIVKTRRAKK